MVLGISSDRNEFFCTCVPFWLNINICICINTNDSGANKSQFNLNKSQEARWLKVCLDLPVTFHRRNRDIGVLILSDDTGYPRRPNAEDPFFMGSCWCLGLSLGVGQMQRLVWTLYLFVGNTKEHCTVLCFSETALKFHFKILF